MKKICIVLSVCAPLWGLTSCVNNGGNSVQEQSGLETLMGESVQQPLDTISGLVGEDTSMNFLQLITSQGDTLELELNDEVDRQASIEVGNRIDVVVQRDIDSTLTVISTHDADLN